MSKINTADSLYKKLANATGTEHYYVLCVGSPLKYTDGVRSLAELAEAYWLISFIDTRIADIYKLRSNLREFALIRIISKDNSGFIEVCSDSGDENKEISYPLEYTDFPEGIFEMYLIDGILLLKTEY